MSKISFEATIESVSRGGHIVRIPAELAAELRHGARVKGTLAGTSYRSSLMKSGGELYLGVHKATLAATGKQTGDTVAVTLDLDAAPRPADTVPPDLTRALAKHAKARAAFEALPPSHKREHVKHILEAKQDETRARRVAKTIETLAKTSPPPRKSSRPKRG